MEDLFRDAMRGMFAIMCSGALRRADGALKCAATQIEIDSLDRTTLLVDFLSEVLTRAHIDRAVFDDVTFEQLTERDLKATISGHASARFEQDIKAVTYHEADVRQIDGGWQTTL